MKRSILLLSLILGGLPATAQYYSSGQDPGSIRWSQVKTDRYRLIFPSSYTEDANYLAHLLDLIPAHGTKTLSARVPRMPILLHAFSSRSNALTVWAPRRIELYPVPPQDTYAEEWYEQLILHEYRHAVQTAKMNRGFSRALYYIFGEQATGAVLGLFIPTWFLEGDAVCTETSLSNSGRGRIPAFENVLRAQVLEKGIYRYDKATMGSYRTFIPNDYVLGYHLTAWGREKFGAGFWNEPLDRSAKYPFMVVPFNSGLRKNSGMFKRTFYSASLSDLKERWTNQQNEFDRTSLKLISTPDKNNYTDYSLPLMVGDSIIIACKESMNHRMRFVAINTETGFEQHIFMPGTIDAGGIGYAGSTLVWSERRPDPRWEHRNYMVLRGYDVTEKRVFDITRKSRYYAPTLSHDGKHIAAVQWLPGGGCSLVQVDIRGREEKIVYRCHDRDFIMEPQWAPDDSRILFILLNKSGKSLCEINLANDSLKTLVPPAFSEIKNPSYLDENRIAFSADHSGIDNIYLYNYIDDTYVQVTSSGYGASQPCMDAAGTNLVYLDYTADGSMIASAKTEELLNIPVSAVRNNSIKLFQSLVDQEDCNIQDSMMNRSPETHPVKKYSKAGHLFNIHSWAPLSLTVSNLSVYPGVSVASQSVLSSMTATAGYRWDYVERTGKVYAGVTYSGWYPVISLDYSYGRREGTATDKATGETSRFTWDESEATLSISIPLNLSRGRWTRTLTPRISSSVTAYLHNSSTPSSFVKGYDWPVSYALSGGNYYYESAKSLYPKWGQLFSLVYKHTPFKGIDAGAIVAASGNLYAPGFFRHHGIWIYSAYQERFRKPDQSYNFSNIISYPRGTESANDDRAVSMQLNYKLPLFYPDWSIGSVVYFKRFKLNLFFDYAEGRKDSQKTYYSSAGGELTADLHLLRFVLPFELGLRAGYGFQNEKPFFEFLYSVNF